MFTMMNMARFNVGLQGVSLAERAYQQARDYAKDRVQGRVDGGSPEKVAIINHPDVRRMLMDIRSQTEAMRALAYETAVQFDISKRHSAENVRKDARAKLDLLTPVVKAWSTDLGVELTSTALQIHGHRTDLRRYQRYSGARPDGSEDFTRWRRDGIQFY